MINYQEECLQAAKAFHSATFIVGMGILSVDDAGISAGHYVSYRPAYTTIWCIARFESYEELLSILAEGKYIISTAAYIEKSIWG